MLEIRRTVLLTIAFLFATPLLAEALFTTPLHLTREVQDPLSQSTTRIEEYCSGDRVISIRGDRTSIADYEKGTLTEIDRSAGTYSVTSFEKIAGARGSQRSADRRQARSSEAVLEKRGVRGVGARSGEVVEAVVDSGDSSRQTIQVVVDHSMSLSKDAIEVLTGAAWPMPRGVESDIAIRASVKENSQGRSQRVDYGLPLEQTVTFEVEGETLRTVNRVVRVGSELPPPELIAIPPGAREAPSPIVERERLLEELDRLPSQVQP